LARVPDDGSIVLEVQPFESVSTPPVVLDALSLFVSHDENGTALSVLRATLPGAIGPRFRVQPVEGARIWSLKVNGRNREVYAEEGGAWVLPLAGGTDSEVELAYVTQGEKLGLHGRLDMVLPKTDLPARRVQVGIGLPGRVQLLSLEGPVSPVPPGEAPGVPDDFAGKPHFFSRSFYGGEGMALAASYKEPVAYKEGDGR
jgi:hypothetical protein